MRRTAWLALLASLCFAAFGQRSGSVGSGTSSTGGHAGGGGRGGHSGGQPAPAAAPRSFSGGGPGTVSLGGPAIVSPIRPSPGVAFAPNASTGSVLHPGFPNAQGVYNPFSFNTSFGARLATTVGNFGPPPGRRGGGRRPGPGSVSSVVVPYAVPVYVPAYGYGGYGYGYGQPYADQPYVDPNAASNYYPPDAASSYPQPAPGPQVIYVVPAQQPPSSGVVTYVVPPRDHSGEPSTGVSVTTASQNGAGRPLFLIALKSNIIYSATEAWVQGDTMHYVTADGAHNQVSLDQVDVDFTTRINRERGIDFQLQPQQ